MEKTCNKCKQTKEITLFVKRRSTKDGYDYLCKICKYAATKAYKQKCKSEEREYNKNYYQANKDSGIYKKYRQKYKDKMRIYSKKYNAENREKINQKRKDRRRLCINNRLKHTLSRRILSAVKSSNVKKSNPTSKLLGCEIEFFKEYIASKFTSGMSWENYGYYTWHIDHIIPCNSFDLSDDYQQKKCFHYTNLQPLWATTEIAISNGENSQYIGNINKGNKKN